MAAIDLADYFEFDPANNRLIVKRDMVLGTSNTIQIGTATISDGGDVYAVSIDGTEAFRLQENAGVITKQESNLITYSGSIILENEATLVLQASIAGSGWLMVGDDEEYASFRFRGDKVVTLLSDCTTNISNTDEANTLSIYPGSTAVELKNNLGVDKKITFVITYYIIT